MVYNCLHTGDKQEGWEEAIYLGLIYSRKSISLAAVI